ncbi:MAG: two-component regulator propeller domain-containing protein [Ginsengibacter sp.]
MLKTIVLLFSITSCSLLFAQNDLYQFEAIDVKNGLSGNQVNSIVKDEKGFVWFGTNAGLDRYDGYDFKIFKHKIGDTATLSDDYISQVMPGPYHTLWTLTRNGWNIFDPQTEKFTTHLQNTLHTLGIPDESFTSIVEDGQKNYWFVYPGKGLYRFNRSSGKTILYNSHSHCSLYSNNVTTIIRDQKDFIWIAYSDGMIEKMDAADDKIVSRVNLLHQISNGQNLDYRLFADADNDIWIYSVNVAKGIYYYKPSSNSILPVNKDSREIRLNNNIITGIVQDDKGNIWIATDHGGINVIDKQNFSIHYITNNENDNKSISQNSLTTLYKDNDGIIWMGTFKKGINYFHESTLKFPLYTHLSGNRGSLTYNDVNKFAEDQKGNLWIGTNGGGLIYFNRATGNFKQYLHDTSDKNSLTNNVIVSLWMDHEQKLWIGTYYGGMDCYDGKKFIHYKHDDKDLSSLADDRVWEIFEDSQDRLWIGTLSEGLELFDRKNNKFIHHKVGTGNTIRCNYISAIIEDTNGNIWIGTAFGIDILDKSTGLFRHFEHIENDKTSLSHNNVIDILQDSRGLIWVATRDGLNLYDPQKKEFKTYRIEEGLPDNFVLTVLEDNNHNLWLSTLNGLSNAIVSTSSDKVSLHFINYDETDGLQGRQFNENGAFKTKNGELVFGGANGFNVFLPSKITGNKVVPNLVLTDLQVFNKSVAIGEKYNRRIVLDQSITETKEVTLQYNQNVFAIEFAALAFLNSQKIKYAYKLEGFSNEWLTTDARNRKATFTNLDPGNYTLLIKAGNEDGLWSNKPLSLKIKILPPFWLTPFAFFIYVLISIGCLVLGRNLILRRAKMKFKIEQERQDAHKLHELDMMKIKFFTNVSHEFRTPLSLIITPVEKLIKETSVSDDKKQFQLIHRNARRLLNLVNQLLDFRKLEERELRLNKKPGDIISFVKEITQSFSDLAENKKISFSFHSSQDIIFTDFDHDKIERILFNLLSNAFKFTPGGGKINVYTEIVNSGDQRMLQLKVADTGIGISKDRHDKIFERFFQNEIPGSMVNQGNGIGLAITKEFTNLHGGKIIVKSEPGKGSCFSVSIPILPVAEDKNGLQKQYDNPEDFEQENINFGHATIKEDKNTKGRKKSILLVEDNDDFRFYIKDNLRSFYNMIEAKNGKLGWQKALSEHPDLIVCDISMPEMNGIDLCLKLKADSRTSFIPVMLLTAMAGEEQQLAGLQTGANDYMIKPFNFEILHSKIKNLLCQQDSFKKTYQKQVQVNASEVIAESADDKFIQQALAVIERNISNPAFSVEEMSREMFMSRVALYKKIFALSGKTPIEFIRVIRLQRAAQLLEKNEMSVAEVAYEVGFNNPKYFSRHFKDEYNILPSSYHNERKSGQKKV